VVSISYLDRKYPWLLWAGSYAVWISIALVSACSMYRFGLLFDASVTFWQTLKIPLINNLIIAGLTPVVIRIGLRYPLQRSNWALRTFLYGLGGLVFTATHVLIRIMVYPVVDAMTKQRVPVGWPLFERVFLYDLVEDCFYFYLPILLVTHLLLYYQQARDRELRASQLETRLVQTQLKALKSQLQPHFLFNTLHSISALMMIDVAKADQMMARLSDLLRMSLEGSSWQETTLNRELQFVNGYLEIEKMRLGERLKIRTAIDSDTLDALVPHLLLQPLVENAIRHGISKLPGGGEVWISARKQENELHLQVGDNGSGFLPGTAATEKHGVGLIATEERLRGLYGDQHRLEIQSTSGKGTIVHVKIPFHTGAGQPKYDLDFIHGFV